MHIDFGNVSMVDTQGTGWIVGFSEWVKTGGANLRYMPQHALAQTLCIKWFHHPQGDPHGSGKPLSEGRSISFLVSAQGRFRLEFSEQADFPAGHTVTHVLATHGDFVMWGEGVYHRWFAEEASSILTVRWVPILPPHLETGEGKCCHTDQWC